jgi:hypothetical protein
LHTGECTVRGEGCRARAPPVRAWRLWRARAGAGDQHRARSVLGAGSGSRIAGCGRCAAYLGWRIKVSGGLTDRLRAGPIACPPGALRFSCCPSSRGGPGAPRGFGMVLGQRQQGLSDQRKRTQRQPRGTRRLHAVTRLTGSAAATTRTAASRAA